MGLIKKFKKTISKVKKTVSQTANPFSDDFDPTRAALSALTLGGSAVLETGVEITGGLISEGLLGSGDEAPLPEGPGAGPDAADVERKRKEELEENLRRNTTGLRQQSVLTAR